MSTLCTYGTIGHMSTPEPRAFGVDLPTGHEVIGCLCPGCGRVAQVDRVGNHLYGECPACHWTGAKTISRERM